MSAQGHQRNRTMSHTALKRLGASLLILIAVVIVWQVVVWGYHKATWHDMKGRWHAEATSVLGVSIPLGINIQFDDSTATVLDQQVQILKYQRDDSRMHVTVRGASSTQMELTFRREDQDHMVFEGPLGISVRYARIKDE